MKKPIGRILSPSIVRIGGGVSNEVGTVLKELGLENPLIVTDKNSPWTALSGEIEFITGKIQLPSLQFALES